jgi:hypothetical protein
MTDIPTSTPLATSSSTNGNGEEFPPAILRRLDVISAFANADAIALENETFRMAKNEASDFQSQLSVFV